MWVELKDSKEVEKAGLGEGGDKKDSVFLLEQLGRWWHPSLRQKI